MLKLEPDGCLCTCRIHQFKKVEQDFVIFLDNYKSWEAMEEMHVPHDTFKIRFIFKSFLMHAWLCAGYTNLRRWSSSS